MIQFRSDVQVDLIQHAGSDEMIARAARVSTGKDLIEGQKIEGLINYLVKNRHTSPLEHTMATFRIEAPIFVSREAMRHRTFSFNEISGRYAKLPGQFYVPAEWRPVVNDGSGANPRLVEGDYHQIMHTIGASEYEAKNAWNRYEKMLEHGIATEVARNVLPVSTYTAWYQTGNLHAWMNFLSLRTAPNALYEIRGMAEIIERELITLFPIAMTAWRTHHGDPSNYPR